MVASSEVGACLREARLAASDVLRHCACSPVRLQRRSATAFVREQLPQEAVRALCARVRSVQCVFEYLWPFVWPCVAFFIVSRSCKVVRYVQFPSESAVRRLGVFVSRAREAAQAARAPRAALSINITH